MKNHNFHSTKYGNKDLLFDTAKFKNYVNKEILYKNIHNIQTAYIYQPSYLTFLQIVTKAGSQVETKDEWGISHILEHMVFKGSKKRPSSKEIMNSYSYIGAEVNAFTDYDHTNYYVTMLNEVFEIGFDILADMYLNPLLREEDLKKEINPILSELREKIDDPEDFLLEESTKYFLNLYHPILGTKESIINTTVEKIKSFKDQYYNNENMIITGVGGIKPQIFFSKIEEYFANKKKSEVIEYPQCYYKKGELVLQKKDIEEAYFVLLFPAFPYNSKNRMKQNFLNFVLGGMDSSFLFERVREELGLSCYEIYSDIIRNRSFSLLEIFAGISPEQILTLEKEIFTIFDRICNDYIDEETITKAKNIIKTNIIANAETIKGLSSILLNSLLREEYKNPLEEILVELESITKEDLLEIAQKTFGSIFFKGILLPK
ncbi:MAG: M16 family metallopeptidase [Leptonema sp. (in: bacteria)]